MVPFVPLFTGAFAQSTKMRAGCSYVDAIFLSPVVVVFCYENGNYGVHISKMDRLAEIVLQ